MINTHSRVDLFPVQIGDVHFEATCSVFRDTDFVRGRAARHIDGVALAHAGDECSRVGPTRGFLDQWWFQVHHLDVQRIIESSPSYAKQGASISNPARTSAGELYRRRTI